MRRGLILFFVVNITVALLLGAFAYAARDTLGPKAGLLMLPLLVVPLIMAYVAHMASGAVGNPFRALIWGHTWWYFACWLLAVLAGLIVAVVMLGLGAAKLDLAMSEFIQKSADVAAKQAGKPLPPEAIKFMPIGGWIQVFGVPTIGAWLAGAAACLGSFPWLGWFGRRMLAYGRGTAFWVLAAAYGITACIAGVVTNPMDEGWNALPVALRLVLVGLVGLSSVPAMFWLFLRTRSAALPALASASYQASFAAVMVLTAERVPWLAPPDGLLASIGALLIGIALWVWKDPGGKDLAIAAVAFDGTPLTPAQLMQLQEQERSSQTPTDVGKTPGSPDANA